MKRASISSQTVAAVASAADAADAAAAAAAIGTPFSLRSVFPPNYPKACWRRLKTTQYSGIIAFLFYFYTTNLTQRFCSDSELFLRS